MEYEDAVKFITNVPPINWEKNVNAMPEDERGKLCKNLEFLAERAAMLAQYLDERHGYGCGDQGHKKAVKAMNRAGKIIHTKVFGYYAFRDFYI